MTMFVDLRGWDDGPYPGCFCEDCEDLRDEIRTADVMHLPSTPDIRPVVSL